MSDKIRSYEVALEWDGNVIAAATSYSLDINGEEISVGTLDSGEWKKIEGGLKSWSGSLDGMVERGVDSAFWAFVEEFTTADNVPATLAFKATVDGDKYLTGTALITSLSKSGGGEGGQEVETWSASFSGNGALEMLTYTAGV